MFEIGVVGVNFKDDEFFFLCVGVLVCYYNEFFFNLRVDFSLSVYLKECGVLGICGVDIRSLIKILCYYGCLMMVVFMIEYDKNKFEEILKNVFRIFYFFLVFSVFMLKIIMY